MMMMMMMMMIIIIIIIIFLSVFTWVPAHLSFGIITSTIPIYFLHDILAYKAISSCVNSDPNPAKYLRTLQLKDNTKRPEQITRRFVYEFVSMLLLSRKEQSELDRELFVSPECTKGVKALRFRQ